MELLKIKSIEFLVFFLIVYSIYYFTSIRKCKKNENYVPAEVNLIIIKHKIDVKKINLYKMIKTVCFFTSLIMSFSVVLTGVFINKLVWSLLLALAFTIVLAMIIYNFIGNYYKKQENKKIKKSRKK